MCRGRVEGVAAVDDVVDANEGEGAHDGFADGGEAKPAASFVVGVVGLAEDVDAAGVHGGDLVYVDHDAGAGVSEA